MKRRFLYITLAFACAASLMAPLAWASPDDYDPVSGEPKCVKCHTPDKRYSIDYTRDETCVECHGPGLSDAFLNINNMTVLPFSSTVGETMLYP